MTLKKKMLSTVTAVVLGVSSSIAHSAPQYVVNTSTQKVIKTEHFYKYAPPNNDTRYGGCGHAAVQTVLQAFGATNSQ